MCVVINVLPMCRRLSSPRGMSHPYGSYPCGMSEVFAQHYLNIRDPAACILTVLDVHERKFSLMRLRARLFIMHRRTEKKRSLIVLHHFIEGGDALLRNDAFYHYNLILNDVSENKRPKIRHGSAKQR